MSEAELRKLVSGDQVNQVRRENSKIWVAASETPFVRPPPVKPGEKRLGDLTRNEAHVLIRGAVAWGFFGGSLLLGLLAAALSLLAYVMR